MSSGSFQVNTSALQQYVKGPVEGHLSATRQGAASMAQATDSRSELPEVLSEVSAKIDSSLAELSRAMDDVLRSIEGHGAKVEMAALLYERTEQSNETQTEAVQTDLAGGV